MAPAGPKKAATKFPGWDELAAEATRTAETAGSMEPYQLPLDENDIVEIQRFDGESYLRFIDSQRRGDVVGLMEAMFPDDKTRARVAAKMKGVPFEIVDTLGNKVLRHFYGLSISTEEKSGNSPAS
jgi:hypothetical protein